MQSLEVVAVFHSDPCRVVGGWLFGMFYLGLWFSFNFSRGLWGWFRVDLRFVWRMRPFRKQHSYVNHPQYQHVFCLSSSSSSSSLSLSPFPPFFLPFFCFLFQLFMNRERDGEVMSLYVLFCIRHIWWMEWFFVFVFSTHTRSIYVIMMMIMMIISSPAFFFLSCCPSTIALFYFRSVGSFHHTDYDNPRLEFDTYRSLLLFWLFAWIQSLSLCSFLCFSRSFFLSIKWFRRNGLSRLVYIHS